MCIRRGDRAIGFELEVGEEWEDSKSLPAAYPLFQERSWLQLRRHASQHRRRQLLRRAELLCGGGGREASLRLWWVGEEGELVSWLSLMLLMWADLSAPRICPFLVTPQAQLLNLKNL